jgi:YbgC/YbaW family acyl-CoA thioester hydrolase
MSTSNTFVHSIAVRYQDCDAYGIVNAVNYLHFLLETTMAHNAALGYTFDKWMKRGFVWVIRDTEIEFIRPLNYGDIVDVSVRLGEPRRISVSRFYELREQTTGALAARARSEFAAVSLETQRPIPLPEDMAAAYFPKGIPEKLPPRSRFPKAPPPPRDIFRWRTVVEWRDLDAQRHVNNATYLSYMQMAVLEQNEEIGWPIQRILRQNQAGVTQWIHILYQGQAQIGDKIEVASYFSDLGTTSCTRHDVVRRLSDDFVLARGHTRWIWIDLETWKPVAIPADYLSALEGYFAD